MIFKILKFIIAIAIIFLAGITVYNFIRSSKSDLSEEILEEITIDTLETVTLYDTVYFPAQRDTFIFSSIIDTVTIVDTHYVYKTAYVNPDLSLGDSVSVNFECSYDILEDQFNFWNLTVKYPKTELIRYRNHKPKLLQATIYAGLLAGQDYNGLFGIGVTVREKVRIIPTLSSCGRAGLVLGWSF
jgi:hypothetical protein